MARGSEGESGAPETIIGATVKVEGDLISEGDIRVDGLVTGKVKTNQNLYIGQTAKIEADVEAGNIDLAGAVTGQVKANDLLTVKDTGKVKGDISCTRLSVAEGALFSGNCSMPEEVEQELPEEEQEQADN